MVADGHELTTCFCLVKRTQAVRWLRVCSALDSQRLGILSVWHQGIDSERLANAVDKHHSHLTGVITFMVH